MGKNGGISCLLQRNARLVIALLFCVNTMWIFLLMDDMSVGLKVLSFGVSWSSCHSSSGLLIG